MNIKRTDKITDEELWRIAHQKSIDNQIKSRKWNWIGHTLRTETRAIEKTALHWNPHGYRRIGRPKRMWQRTVKDEISTRRSWNEAKGIAEDRNVWKLFMDALCSTRSNDIHELKVDNKHYTNQSDIVNLLNQHFSTDVDKLIGNTEKMEVSTTPQFFP